MHEETEKLRKDLEVHANNIERIKINKFDHDKFRLLSLKSFKQRKLAKS